LDGPRDIAKKDFTGVFGFEGFIDLGGFELGTPP